MIAFRIGSANRGKEPLSSLGRNWPIHANFRHQQNLVLVHIITIFRNSLESRFHSHITHNVEAERSVIWHVRDSEMRSTGTASLAVPSKPCWASRHLLLWSSSVRRFQVCKCQRGVSWCWRWRRSNISPEGQMYAVRQSRGPGWSQLPANSCSDSVQR